jgi:hypothetical protein
MACKGCSCGMAEIEKARSVDTVEIRQRDPSKLLDASNTIVILNGVPLKNPQSIEVKITNNGDAIVKLELFAKVDMDRAIVKDLEVKDETNRA